MRNWFFILIHFFLCSSGVEAATINSVQDGDFFASATWENNQVPNLSSDSIVVQHDVTFNQVIQLSGNAHLKIEFCERLCGNFNLYIGPGASLFNEGGLFTDTIYSQGNVVNHGIMVCSYMKISAGEFKNANGGYFSAQKGPRRCSDKFVPTNAYSFSKVNPNTVRIGLKCPAEIDFGDTTVVVSTPGSVYHSYKDTGIFNINIKVYCSCDTPNFLEQFEVDYGPSSISGPCQSFLLYPNPNNGEFHVKPMNCLKQTEEFDVSMFNSAGQFICDFTLRYNTDNHITNLPDVASGVYYLRVYSWSGFNHQKIVIIK